MTPTRQARSSPLCQQGEGADTAEGDGAEVPSVSSLMSVGGGCISVGRLCAQLRLKWHLYAVRERFPLLRAGE